MCHLKSTGRKLQMLASYLIYHHLDSNVFSSITFLTAQNPSTNHEKHLFNSLLLPNDCVIPYLHFASILRITLVPTNQEAPSPHRHQLLRTLIQFMIWDEGLTYDPVPNDP
ncbi:hypothetical protein TNCV_3944821 [Trichonephila clavipes]|nr:hypothetical protein TNCV_3944821 [Trichonephila clavipes]